MKIEGLADLKAALELGRQRYDDGDNDAAVEIFATCLKVAPKEAAIWSQLGSALRRQGRARASVAAHRKALEIDPENPAMRSLYGNALIDAQLFEEAISVRRSLLEEQPDRIDYLGRVVEALHCDRQQDEAIALIDAAEATQEIPERMVLQRAVANLARGYWAEGFAEFDSRFYASPFVSDDRIRWPQWRGEDLAGKSLLVLNEQGFGDVLFTTRFLPALKDMGADVSLVAAEPLRRLLAGTDAINVVRSAVDRHDVFDFYTYAMSIPRRLGFDGTAFPAPLTFDLPRTSRDRARAITAPFAGRLKIGFVWTGSIRNPVNAARAVSPDRFIALAEMPGVQLFSLYKGEAVAELKDSGLAGIAVNVGETDADFADTAAMIDAMDLIVTVDTAVAHLAGTRGKETWLLLSRQGFWYFGHGDTTPWYPSMRLYHQPTHGDWDSVFRLVEKDLRTLLGLV